MWAQYCGLNDLERVTPTENEILIKNGKESGQIENV